MYVFGTSIVMVDLNHNKNGNPTLKLFVMAQYLDIETTERFFLSAKTGRELALSRYNNGSCVRVGGTEWQTRKLSYMCLKNSNNLV